MTSLGKGKSPTEILRTTRFETRLEIKGGSQLKRGRLAGSAIYNPSYVGLRKHYFAAKIDLIPTNQVSLPHNETSEDAMGSHLG